MLKEDIRQATILIVDDEPMNVLLLKEILKSEGYTHIHGTTDSREALLLYQQHQPDLVLLDLQMPHLDGFQVMEQLKEEKQDSHLPVLVITAERERDVRLRALQCGATDFLNKPVDLLEATLRIRNMLEVRLLYKALANQNQVLEEKVKERTKELRDTRLEIIQRLVHASEYRDRETGLHIARMSLYCSLLGRAAGMSEKEAELLQHASPMHDLGKIGIPDRILLKPAKLDAEEWEIMKRHSLIGAELLSNGSSSLMRMGQVVALTHHERWDGSGYPHGLKGEDISLVGRICGLCDVFDALTSDRPYKKAWTVEEALSEIKQGSGKHFQPELVRLFEEIFPEILAVKRTLSEQTAQRAEIAVK